MIKNTKTFSIRETAEILVPDKLGRTSYLIAILLIITMFSVITLLITKIPTVVPIYFTLPWGEARLAPKYMLYILPAITVIFLVFNLGLGRLSRNISPLLPLILAVATAVVSGMMIFSLLGILQSLIL